MHVGVRNFGAGTGVNEAGIESFNVESSADALPELAQHLPDDALFLNVEVVKAGNVAAWSDHYVARDHRMIRRDGNRVFVDDPSVFTGR